MMIGIVDYGAGNVGSLRNALDHLGFSCEVSSDPERLRKVERIVFPGVGSFGAGMKELRARGLGGFLKEYAAGDRPFLGICLGMQVCMESSEESPGVAGLGLVPGGVRRFRQGKVPHMGWNEVVPERGHPVLGDESFHAYFVHSFYVEPSRKEQVVGWTEYGIRFPSVMVFDRTLFVQFHPELSGDAGMALLKRFCSC
jgi:glutamine amidotransferase/cyclase